MAGKGKLSILYLTSDPFPPFRVDISVLFGREISGRGHRIDWLLQDGRDRRKPYTTEWLGSRAFVGPRDNGTSLAARIRKHLYDIVHDSNLFRLLKTGEYDMILVRDKFFAPLMALVAVRRYKLKCVYWLSYPFPEDFLYQVQQRLKPYPLFYWLRGHFLRLLLYRVIIPFSHHTFVQSEKMQEDIANCGIQKDKMTPVPMGVSIDNIPYFGYGPPGSSGSGQRTVLYLGTLSRVRKLDFLLRAFKKLLSFDSSVKLVLVGGGDVPEDEAFLRAEALKMGIEDSVVFTGFLPQDQAWEYVRTADVCVSPFYPTPILQSTSPTKLLEYMAMGKASVANDHPEQSRVIRESGAGLCVPWDEDAFASAIFVLLNDFERRKAMGLRGREYVERHRDYGCLSRFVETKLMDIMD